MTNNYFNFVKFRACFKVAAFGPWAVGLCEYGSNWPEDPKPPHNGKVSQEDMSPGPLLTAFTSLVPLLYFHNAVHRKLCVLCFKLLLWQRGSIPSVSPTYVINLPLCSREQA